MASTSLADGNIDIAREAHRRYLMDELSSPAGSRLSTTSKNNRDSRLSAPKFSSGNRFSGSLTSSRMTSSNGDDPSNDLDHQPFTDNSEIASDSDLDDYTITSRATKRQRTKLNHHGARNTMNEAQSSSNTTSNTRAKDVLVVGIDFGTTYSAVAYGCASVRTEGTFGKSTIECHDMVDVNFPGEANENLEIATVLTYSGRRTNGFKFGVEELEDVNAKPEDIIALAKMLFDNESLKSNQTLEKAAKLVHRLEERKEPRGGAVKPTTAVDVWSDVLKWLCRKAFSQIIHGRKYPLGTTQDGYQYINLPVHYALCIPASWSLATTNQALTALKMACNRTFFMCPEGRISFTKRETDHQLVRFFSLVREPIAATASVFAYQELLSNIESRLDRLKSEENALVLDIGGGTTDAAFVTRQSEVDGIVVNEMISGDGCCGVMRWTSLLREVLQEKYAGRWQDILGTPNPRSDSIEQFLRAIETGFEKEKKSFRAAGPEMVSIQVQKHLGSSLRPDRGLGSKDAYWNRSILRSSVFDPVINEIITLIKKQLKKFQNRYDRKQVVKYLLLVGSPSRNEYLVDRLRHEFEDSTFDVGIGQHEATLKVKNNMVITSATMNSRGAVLVVGNQMIGTQYLQYNLAVGQDVPWTQADYPSLKTCPYQDLELISKCRAGRWKGGIPDGKWRKARQNKWKDRNDARCGYEKMKECPPDVKHFSVPENTMIVRDTVHWIMTRTMPLRPEETYRIPGYRLIPFGKIGHTWREKIWISRTEHPVQGCLLFDPKNEIQTFYEIAFSLKEWKRLGKLASHAKGSTKLYRVEYLLEIQKIGPAMNWKVTIPKHGEFESRDSDLWEAELEELKHKRIKPFISKGEITNAQSNGQAFTLGSDTVIATASRDIA